MSQLTFSLLAVGLSLAPGLIAFVPLVLRDAHGSVLAGKHLELLNKKHSTNDF